MTDKAVRILAVRNVINRYIHGDSGARGTTAMRKMKGMENY
jgi:hypothetical protein